MGAIKQKFTLTHWEWTELAEKRWEFQQKEPRRAGQMLTKLDSRGNRVKREFVPMTWVKQGYVREAEAEQIELF